MSNSSAGSSGFSSRNAYYGVPTKCWCGEGVVTLTSKTNENPYRRFYRCLIGQEMKMEKHLFKWADEALLDEIRILGRKYMSIVEELKDMKKDMEENFDLQRKLLSKIEDEMKQNIKEKIETEMVIAKGSMYQQHIQFTKSSLKTMGVTVVVLSAVVWLVSHELSKSL